MNRHISHALLFCLLGLAATASAQTRATPRPVPSSTASRLVEPSGPTAVIDTSAGRFTCKLYTQQAPVTVANFVALAEGTKDWIRTRPARSSTANRITTPYKSSAVQGVTSGNRAAYESGSAGPDSRPRRPDSTSIPRRARSLPRPIAGKQSSSGFAITDHPDLSGPSADVSSASAIRLRSNFRQAHP